MAAVTATLRADVAQYIAAMKQAGAATQAMASTAAKAGERASSQTKRFATNAAQYVSKNKDHINTVANGLGVFGAAVGAGVAVAAKKFADFDQAMSHVAASGEDAKNNLGALKDAAMEAGASTAFSATEAAAGVENLLKAGVSAKDVLGGGLDGALNLAAAGSMDVADAAETAATAMTQFNLSGKDVPHIADLLAQAAGTAQGEVSDMAQAMNQAGLVSAQFGLSVDDTAQTLALFAKNGLLGSDAGTSLKTMLLRLANPSKEAAETMRSLGINAYDAQGQFVGMDSLADQLQKTMSGLSQAQRDAALSTIFGSDAIRSANVLVKSGADGWRQMGTDMRNFGSAADVAKTKMDNLKGDLENLSGAFETALIGMGEGANGPLRSLVQSATDAVNAFNSLGSGTKSAVLVTAASIAGLALSAAAIGKIAIFAAEARTALVGLGITSRVTAASMSGLAGAAGPAAVALLGVAAGASALNQLGTHVKNVDELESALAGIADGTADLNAAFSGANWADTLMGQLTTGITPAKDLQSALAGLAVSQDTALGKFSAWREKITPGTQSIEKAQEQVTALDGALSSMVSKGQGDQAAAALEKMGVSSEQVARFFPQYSAALKSSQSAAAGSAAANEQAATSMDKAGASAQDQAAAIQAATDAMYAQANAALTLSGNAIAVEAAMDAAAKSVKENGKNLDISTAKGRANQQALDALASATLTATQAMVENGESTKSIVDVNERAKASWIANARAMGMNGEEARRTAESLFAIPKEIKSQVVVAGAKVSKQEAADLNKALNDIPPEKRAEIVTIAETKGAKAAKKAMDEVHAKQVLAKTVGDIKGAKNVDDAMKKLRDRLVKAKASGDKKGADIVRAAMNLLKDKKVDAKANAIGKGGVDALRGAVNALHDKTVTATVITRRVTKEEYIKGGATGGLFVGGDFMMRGPLRRSNGGPVWGAGTATSDSIPALLSNGEFVINARSVSMIGADRLAYMNRTGAMPAFAEGGMVGAARFAAGGLVDAAVIMRLIAQLSSTLSPIAAAARVLAAARSVSSRENRESVSAKAAYERALAADKRADAEVKRDGSKADKARAKKTEAAKDKAYEAYQKQLDQQKDAAAKLSDATNALADANNAAADAARSMSDQFSSAFRSGSTDAKDWLDLMKQGAGDLAGFTSQIAQLRKAGLSESLIQQILGQGAVTGGETAANILAGGKGLISQLNSANQSLEKAADALGYLGSTGAQRKALGGPISGPGTGTSDSVPIMASNGEYIVNAASTALHRPLLDSINYGRNVISHRYAAPGHYRYGGVVTSGRGVSTGEIAAAVEAGLSRATFTGYIDGQPFRVLVTSELRARGRSGKRTA